MLRLGRGAPLSRKFKSVAYTPYLEFSLARHRNYSQRELAAAISATEAAAALSRFRAPV